MARLLELPSDEAHLWYAHPEQITNTETLEKLLSPEEDQRRRRFVFERDRHTFLVTRALVRTVLSRYAAVAPETWCFTANRYGKPEIAAPVGLPPLRFNVSHTQGLTACLVALDREVGLDVEHLDRRPVTIGLAESYFAPAEVASLRPVPAEEFMSRFLDIWTLKEAYIKAAGKGLSQPLAEFAFHIPIDGPVQIHFEPQLQDDPAHWQFERFEMASRHKIAVALPRRGSGKMKVVLQAWSP